MSVEEEVHMNMPLSDLTIFLVITAIIALELLEFPRVIAAESSLRIQDFTGSSGFYKRRLADGICSENPRRTLIDALTFYQLTRMSLNAAFLTPFVRSSLTSWKISRR